MFQQKKEIQGKEMKSRPSLIPDGFYRVEAGGFSGREVSKAYADDGANDK